MPRYIDADTVVERLDKIQHFAGNKAANAAINLCKDIVRNAPTVSTDEVRGVGKAELIKALRMCGEPTNECPKCPRYGTDNCHGVFKDAADAIEELLAKDTNVPDKWISVEERLPELYRVVLVVADDPADYLHGYGFAARQQDGTWVCGGRKILFWMPLPEPPEEGTE